MTLEQSWIQKVLPRAIWQKEREAHQAELTSLLQDQVKRRSHNEKDPVMDFLFEYYSFRPKQLLRWTPGFGFLLEASTHDKEEHFPSPKFQLRGTNLGLYPQELPFQRIAAIRWITKVLTRTLEKPAFFGCFGMHEWAMVYKMKQSEIRHAQFPLRFSEEKVAEFVESRPIICSHFEAFRFFTEAAKPLNQHQPGRLTMQDFEQSGCLHTNMDLYKWAYKMYPWMPSSLIKKTFLFACEIRLLDLKASPYDLSSMGIEPIKIETDEGKKQYFKEQQQIQQTSMAIRKELLKNYEVLLDYMEANLNEQKASQTQKAQEPKIETAIS